MFRSALLCVAVLFAATSAFAQGGGPQRPIDYASLSDRELNAAFLSARDSWTSNGCGIGEPLFTEMYKRRPEREIRNALLWSKVICLDSRKEYAGARAVLSELEAHLPLRAILPLGLYLDSRLEDSAGIISRLSKFADLALDGDAGALEADAFYQARRMVHSNGRQSELEAVALKLYSSAAYPAFEPELQGAIAYSALGRAAVSGDRETVEGLLSELRDPQVYPALLSLRKYEAIWPQIERRVGEGFSAITSEYRDWADARFTNLPGDRDRFSEAVRSLFYDGRFTEAADMALKWRERQESLENTKEGDAWALNMEAYSLDALGRIAEADAIFDRLAALSPEGRDWLVNFVINRSSRLVGQKRFVEGLAAAQLARTVAANTDRPTPKCSSRTIMPARCTAWVSPMGSNRR